VSPRERKKAPNLFDAFDVDTPVVTEVRRLLQNLTRQSKTAERRVLLVTSAARGEGKTTISGLLALVSAHVFRKRTLLIDADLRRPAVHHLFGISQRPGLYELLHDEATLERVTRTTPYPTLSIITSGHPVGPAGEAYDDDAFQALLASLRTQYDLIYVDSAPVVPVVEPLLMAEHADAILLVAMAGQTPVSLLRRMKQIVAPVRQKVAGVILNNATDGLPYYYDYRYYGYAPDRRGKRKRTTEDGESAAKPESAPDATRGAS
jgi:capsular exopolysaccharide synthesis family protein